MELLGKSLEELRAYCKSLGEPEYRGGQIYHALYAERKFDFAGMTNLPGSLREKLAREASITLPEVRRRYLSKDGSMRYLLGIGEHREENDETNTAEAGGGGSGVHAGRGAADDLHFDAGGLRGGLPVLPDGATPFDSEFDAGGNCGAGAGAAERNGRGSRKEFRRGDKRCDR